MPHHATGNRRPTAAVIPASGSAERMDGRPKLLLPIGDTTVLGWTCRALLGAGVAEIMVVVHYDDDELQDWCRECGLEMAVNLQPEQGMLASIQCGIRELGGPEALTARQTDLLVTPGDLPAMKPLDVREVLLAADHHPDALVVPRHEDRRGHPLRVPPELIGEIFDLDPDIGLRQLLEEHPDRVHEVPVEDPGVVLDLDTEVDYRRLCDLVEGGGAG